MLSGTTAAVAHGRSEEGSPGKGDWLCGICFRTFPSFAEACPRCHSIGSVDVNRKIATARQLLFRSTRPVGVRVWAQSKSFKVLDPTLLSGFCRALCLHWILKRKEGKNFWAWLETVEGRTHVINLQVAYKQRTQKLPGWRGQPGWSEQRVKELGQQRVTLWKRKGVDPSVKTDEAHPQIPGQIEVRHTLTQRVTEDGVSYIEVAPVIHEERWDSELSVEDAGRVTVPGGVSYRNVLREQQVKKKDARGERKKVLQKDPLALAQALEKNTIELNTSDFGWLQTFLAPHGIDMAPSRQTSSKKELADWVKETPGFKLISLKGGTSGHAVVAHTLDKDVVYMDPNEGEFVVTHKKFERFFEQICGKYNLFFLFCLTAR